MILEITEIRKENVILPKVGFATLITSKDF